ncbi:MAG: pyruvate kinase [Spirochaetaceae bacterium]|nr:pyruvate kinase [Spirochaetaceae bacterium]
MFTRKTKIVCSMGPATANDEVVEQLLVAGMNIARFNFSHGTHQSHQEAMERVRRAAKKVGKPVALLLDTKGPEIRTGDTVDGGTVTIKAGDKVIVTSDGQKTQAPGKMEGGGQGTEKPALLSVSWKELPKRAVAGVRILIADGLLELEVIESDGNKVTCVAKNTGTIGSKKNVNLVGLHAMLPILGEQDKADIAFGVQQEVDFIAASFVSFASEIYEIRRYLDSLHSKAKIIAKIENEEGVANIEEIAEAADGIMIARGDLGVQLPTEKIPLVQKHIIGICRQMGKPVITATQMLESMVVNPRPTRAELTDVANAIFDGTDAVMLSGETANGAYPVAAVETMAKIALSVEDSPEFCQKMRVADTSSSFLPSGNIGMIMARNAYTTARDVKAMVIITPTLSGHTSRMISKFRPEQSIIAVTPDPVVARQLLLFWGVVPLHTQMASESDEMIQNAIKVALDAGVVNISDRAVLAAGIPLFSSLMLNTVKVLLVGNVLARGNGGGSSSQEKTKTTGRIIRSKNALDALAQLQQQNGGIIVCPTITQDYIPLLRLVDGVIAENGSEVSDAMLALVNPNLVWLTNVSGATTNLESGLMVTIDGSQLLVYEGII